MNTRMSISNRILQVTAWDKSEPQFPVNAFFTSLAKDRGASSIGVVLSGSGSDGTLGLKAIHAAGGTTFCQDSSAAFPGMPRNAFVAGTTDFMLSPAGIAEEICALAGHPYYGDRDSFARTQEGSGKQQLLAMLR